MMKVLCTRAANCEDGVTSIEYGLIAALMSVALLTGAGAMGDTITGQFKTLSKKLDVAADGPKQFGPGTALVSVRSDLAPEPP